MTQVGFIGLGIMGGPMAGHLQKAGHKLATVKHRSALPQEITTAGRWCVPLPRKWRSGAR